MAGKKVELDLTSLGFIGMGRDENGSMTYYATYNFTELPQAIAQKLWEVRLRHNERVAELEGARNGAYLEILRRSVGR